MNLSDFPNLKSIHLHTNGQLFTKKNWNMLKSIRHVVKSVEISIDACSEKTYSLNRRGGNYKRLLENLKFISSLKDKRDIRYVRISFVVQNNNYLEMLSFAKLGNKFKFDDIYFSKLLNWGTFTDSEYKKRAIHIPTHPNHKHLIEELKKVKEVPKTNIGNLLPLISVTQEKNSFALEIEKNKKYFKRKLSSIKKKFTNNRISLKVLAFKNLLKIKKERLKMHQQ